MLFLVAAIMADMSVQHEQSCCLTSYWLDNS